jgi:hypothetical protein
MNFGRMSDTPESTSFKRLLDSGLLEAGVCRLVNQLKAQPHRPALLRQLGNIYRQMGRLNDAAEVYGRLAHLYPDDAPAGWLAALLQGRALPPNPPIGPAFFYVWRGFLAPGRLEQVFAFAQSHKTIFEGAARPGARWCTNVLDLDSLGTWLEPSIEAILPEVARQLSLRPFSGRAGDCKLTYYGHGSSHGPHVDQGPGFQKRMWGFMYHFHFPPQRFTGGEVALYDRDLETGGPAPSCTLLSPEHNSLVFVSSNCWHEVLSTDCKSQDWNAGRFALHGWIYRV